MTAPFALLSPMPPQRTGIADYADGLVSGLRERGIEVDVYAPSRFIANDNENGRKYQPISGFDYKQYPPDKRIYQIGNNTEFHDEITLFFLQNGGIAHIHDLCLHHIFAYFTFLKDSEIYYTLLKKWYGDVTSQEIRAFNFKSGALFWESKYVLNYPLNEEVLTRAHAIIVHSEFAKTAIASRFPDKPVYVIPQRYPGISAQKHCKADRLKICSMGFVDPNKCVDKNIEAIAFCREAGVEVQLDIVGRLHPQCQDLPDRCAELGVADLVTFHGAVDHAVFGSFLANSDVAIVLRDPTVGETSAVAMRALQFGIPLIVNEVGSYAELPGFVQKIPPGPSASRSLANILCEFATTPNRYDEISDAAFTYATREGTFDTSIKQYIAALETIGNGSQPVI